MEDNTEEIKKLWSRVVALEERLAHHEKLAEIKPTGGGVSDDKIQTLTAELKHHGIHSSLYVEPAPAEEFDYGAEAQGTTAWTEKNDGTTA